MSDGRVTKMVYDGDVPGRHPRGRPRKSWRSNFNWHCMHLLSNYINFFSCSALDFTYFAPAVNTGRPPTWEITPYGDDDAYCNKLMVLYYAIFSCLGSTLHQYIHSIAIYLGLTCQGWWPCWSQHC